MFYLRWECERGGEGSDGGALALLEDLKIALQRVVQEDQSNMSELRFLLISSLSRVRPPQGVDNWLWLRSFILDSSPPDSEKAVKSDLLRMCLEKAPSLIGEFLSRHPKIVRGFFRDDPSRIPQWFSHFSSEGLTKFRWGAKALAIFSLAKRDKVWEFLVWGGRHSQAPVAVATKLHYFCELKVKETVENLLNECPEFWVSQEFRNCLKNGDVVSLDPDFFIEELYEDWTGRDSEVTAEIEDVIAAVVGRMETCEWIHRIEIHLSDREIRALLEIIASNLRESKIGRDSLLNTMFSIRWGSLDDAMLANALAVNPSLLMNFLKAADEALAERIVQAAVVLHTSPDIHEGQCHLLKKTIAAFARDTEFLYRWLEILSLEIALDKRFDQGGVEALNSILAENRITFRLDSSREKYALLTSSSDGDDRKKSRSRKRKAKKHKKKASKRKKLSHDDERNVMEAAAGRVWQLTLFQSRRAASTLECHGHREVMQALLDHAKHYWCPVSLDDPCIPAGCHL